MIELQDPACRLLAAECRMLLIRESAVLEPCCDWKGQGLGARGGEVFLAMDVAMNEALGKLAAGGT